MTIHRKKIKQLIQKIEGFSEEDLKKVEALVEKLNVDKDNVNEVSDTTAKRLRVQDFSFTKAKKLTEKLNSSLADEVIKERKL